MADKSLGLGSLVKVDHDADTNYTTVGLTKDFTPPGRDKELVETTTLSDTIKQFAAAIEDGGDLTVMHLWDPTDSNHTMIDTLITNGTTVNWQVVTAHATPITGQFAGIAYSYTPEKVEVNGVWARTFKVRRTGAIAYT